MNFSNKKLKMILPASVGKHLRNVHAMKGVVVRIRCKKCDDLFSTRLLQTHLCKATKQTIFGIDSIDRK